MEAAGHPAAASRRTSPRIHDRQVQTRVATVTPAMRERQGGLVRRIATQAQVLALPAFPTTTIGSFPQTPEVRHARAERCWARITIGHTVGIDIVDDGIGTDGRATPGVGLTGMRERAAQLSGCVNVRTIRPHGTHLHVELPVDPS